MAEQEKLLEFEERPLEVRANGAALPKWRTAERTQMMMAHICVEELIAADHKARAIWELAGRLNLERFAEAVKTQRGGAGRAAWDPRLLVSIWVYAYSEGIGSAREIERRLEYEPGFQWLCGLVKVNHHTLSDFRVNHKKALDELFMQMLALLEKEQLLNLERVMHDGTKVRAQAGEDSFRREKTVSEHLERTLVREMGDPRGGPESAGSGAAAGCARADGTIAASGRRIGKDAGAARARRARTDPSQHERAGSAADEARRSRVCAQLQRADQCGCASESDCRNPPEPKQQRCRKPGGGSGGDGKESGAGSRNRSWSMVPTLTATAWRPWRRTRSKCSDRSPIYKSVRPPR